MRPTITKSYKEGPPCSKDCYKIWTEYNQKPPVWQICSCNCKKRIISFNEKLLI